MIRMPFVLLSFLSLLSLSVSVSACSDNACGDYAAAEKEVKKNVCLDKKNSCCTCRCAAQGMSAVYSKSGSCACEPLDEGIRSGETCEGGRLHQAETCAQDIDACKIAIETQLLDQCKRSPLAGG